MNVVQAIDQLVPDADYGGYPEDQSSFNNLRWNDARPKPGWNEIVPLLPRDPPSPDPVTTEITPEDTERALMMLGLTRGQINQIKNDRGKPIP